MLNANVFSAKYRLVRKYNLYLTENTDACAEKADTQSTFLQNTDTEFLHYLAALLVYCNTRTASRTS